MKPHSLFGTDGVRGVAGRPPLTPSFVAALGLATGNVLKIKSRHPSRSLLVVRDTRQSGPWILRALARGLGRAGYRVLDGGVLPTPAVAVLVPQKKLAAGAVISASHNPAAFNGIKFFGSRGEKLPDLWETAIERNVTGPLALPGIPSLAPAPWAESDYLAFLRSTWPRGLSAAGFPLVVDCANGATGRVAGRVFRSLGCRVTLMHNRPNGRNINKGCGALYPDKLVKKVRQERARLGVAFDGDGDRAIFVDETGALKDGDAVLLIVARHMKCQGRLRGNRVVVTVMANLGLKKALAALDIQVTETPVGDKQVGLALQRVGCALGGEPSGHIIFREFLPTGDGLLTALQVLRIACQAQRPLSVLSSLYVRYPQVLLNVPVKEKRPLESINALQSVWREAAQALSTEGRIVVRYSGTEPLLRVMVEGPSVDATHHWAHRLADAVHKR